MQVLINHGQFSLDNEFSVSYSLCSSTELLYFATAQLCSTCIMCVCTVHFACKTDRKPAKLVFISIVRHGHGSLKPTWVVAYVIHRFIIYHIIFGWINVQFQLKRLVMCHLFATIPSQQFLFRLKIFEECLIHPRNGRREEGVIMFLKWWYAVEEIKKI